MSQDLPPEQQSDVPDLTSETANETSGLPPAPKKPKLTIPTWGKIFLMFLVVFVASIGYFRNQTPQDSKETVTSPLSDEAAIEQRVPAPAVDFTTRSGGTAALSSFKGKVVLMSFWAHWCAPCLVELPSFKALSERLNNHDFAVVPVNLDEKDEGKEFIENFWKDKSLPFETYFDPDKKAVKALNIDTLPANFVLDRQGRIVMSSFGSNDWSADSTVEMIESLLNEKE